MKLKVDVCESMVQVSTMRSQLGRQQMKDSGDQGVLMLRNRWSGSENRQEPHRNGWLFGAGQLDFEISDEGQF